MQNPLSLKPIICLLAALVLPLGACSSQKASEGPSAMTDAAPGTYEYARQCFRALGLQALTSGTQAGQDVMDSAKASAIAAGEKQGMNAAAVLTDLLRQTGEGAREYQSMAGPEQAAFATSNQAFAETCLKAQG